VKAAGGQRADGRRGVPRLRWKAGRAPNAVLRTLSGGLPLRRRSADRCRGRRSAGRDRTGADWHVRDTPLARHRGRSRLFRPPDGRRGLTNGNKVAKNLAARLAWAEAAFALRVAGPDERSMASASRDVGRGLGCLAVPAGPSAAGLLSPSTGLRTAGGGLAGGAAKSAEFRRVGVFGAQGFAWVRGRSLRTAV